MPDNFENNLPDMLVKLMDGELNETQKQAVEKMIADDVNLNERYQLLQLGKRAIRQQGLKQQVSNIQQEFLNQRNENVTSVKKLRTVSVFTRVMKIAAVFFIAVAGYGVFQYASTNTQNVYSNNFVHYQLPISRGMETNDARDLLYNSGSYDKVIAAVQQKKDKNQKDYFLAAQSYLQLNNANAAIDAFKQVENLNKKTNERYYVEETDYYMVLAYIKAGQIKNAEQELKKITSNKQHTFYNKAKSISRIKLFMLELKEN